ncbi:cache domain-containing protein [Vulcanococcus limneticus]|uniref:cache domain-containing protein n=1 Tax=Vulcanococcus limneticus TaxID=2170428 RepID=UPI00398BD059
MTLGSIGPRLRARWRRLQPQDSLARDRWWLSVQLSVTLTVGFGAVALFTYANALAAARRQVVESTLPLTLDALSADLQQDFVQPILFASAMAANTLLIDWVEQGEQPEAAVQRYLSRVQAQHGATTVFFVSEASRRYYHPTGILKTVSPGSAQDAWFFRLRASASPYEVNLDRDTADPSRTTVFVNYKLLGDGGRFLGAVGLGRSTSQLTRRIQQAERTNGIQVMFLDGRGRILFSPRRGQAPPQLQRAIAQQRLRDSLREQPRGAFQFRQGGELIYVRTKRIPELNWTLVVSQPLRVPSGPLCRSAVVVAVPDQPDGAAHPDPGAAAGVPAHRPPSPQARPAGPHRSPHRPLEPAPAG